MEQTEALKEDIKELKSEMHKIHLSQKRIEDAIAGDRFGNKGLVNQVEQQGKDIEDLKRYKWTLTGAVMFGSFLFAYIVKTFFH